tara:strand:+ start:437 stop:853 length:417 start_codon:yes stop_codon:yes gene_type:complete
MKTVRKDNNQMNYTIDKIFPGADIEDIDARTRAALAAAGFGVLTEIDVKATMKKKIDKDLPGYRILGACNPNMAWQAIGMEPKVGAMLPCNVIVRETAEGVEVSAVDPVISMTGINNQELGEVAGQVRKMLQEVVSAI